MQDQYTGPSLAHYLMPVDAHYKYLLQPRNPIGSNCSQYIIIFREYGALSISPDVLCTLVDSQ